MSESIAARVASRGRVLLVDDEPQLLVAYRRVLQRAGFEVEILDSGFEVGARIAREHFDVVISDIGMPTATGLDVLRGVHAYDRDLPVVLMTGRGDLSTALGALEYGAQRYLVKPVEPSLLCRAAEDAVALRRGAKVRSAALEVYHEAAREKSKNAELSHQLDRAVAGMHILYQPIVSWSRLSVVAYEALLRTREPSFTNPGQMLAAAEALGRLPDVGRAVRRNVAEALRSLPQELAMFVNLHPADLEDPELFAPDSPLSAFANRVVLEVTERESLSGFGDIAGHATALRSLGFRLAVDDFGSGYGGLGSLVQLRPDVVKIDMGLVRGVDGDATKRKMVESALSLCAELGMSVVAEGVETAGERDALVAAGYDLMQGFLFARPGRLTGSPIIVAADAQPSARPRFRPVTTPQTRRQVGSNDHSELLRIQGQLDCAPITVVRLDSGGRITHVNAAWRKFATANAADQATIDGIGLDYRAAARKGDVAGRMVADAIGDLLAGTRETFTCVYPCHSPTEARWFRLDARRIAADAAVVVMHTDISEQHAAEARLRLQAVVARALTECAPLLETCRRFVRATCEGLEWDFASVWLPGDGDRLRCVDTWTRLGFDAGQFERTTRKGEVALGEGLAGRVWLTRAPEWNRDVRSDPRWATNQPAPAGLLRAGFAIPLVAEGDVFAVIEFFSRIQREPDHALIELLVGSGARLGVRAIQERAEQRAAIAEAAQRSMRSTLDAIMECVPAFILAIDEQGIIRFINRTTPPYRMEDVIGADALQFLAPEVREVERERMARIIATGVPETYESAVNAPDGSKVIHSIHTSPMRQGDHVVGLVSVTYDVTDIKRAQAEYAANQRLAAVGTLAAGVAHEINTPIQFINDSVHFLRDAVHDVTGLIQGLKQVASLAAAGAPAALLAEAIAAASALEADADLPYLQDNVPKAFDRCIDGLDRVSTIVRSLKEYAHPAKEEMAPTDLNRAIQNTLTIARGEYKYVADLETAFGDIPPVTCHVNDINQVILNLVVNAAHAIGDVVRATDARGRITVRTWQEGEQVLVSISDSGTGIAPEIAGRIFEPFFTTKEVGRGSGQGLAHAWAVIKTKHRGGLTFESSVGQGATFLIQLPINGKPAAQREMT